MSKKIWGPGFALLLISVAALLAPLISPFSYHDQDLSSVLLSPNARHWMGTDFLGRDVFSRVLYGAQVSLLVGLGTGFFSFVLGSVLGGLAGYFGGFFESALTLIFNLVQSIPILVLAILSGVFWHQFKVFTDPSMQSVLEIVLTLSSVGWVSAARMVRAHVRELKNRPFVEAARALGSGHGRILWNHVFPAILGQLLVYIIFQTPTLIILESFLSFLGLGIQAPMASWGVLLVEGWRTLRSYPHLFFGPSLVLFFTMILLNLLGDSIQKYFDPKLRDRLL